MKTLQKLLAVVLLVSTAGLLTAIAANFDGSTCTDPATGKVYQVGDGPCDGNGHLLKKCGFAGVWEGVPANTPCPH
jgi:hypothetical protein